jgi:hypothetical protein
VSTAGSSNINLTDQPNGITVLNGKDWMLYNAATITTSGGKNAFYQLNTINANLFLYRADSFVTTPTVHDQTLAVNGGIYLSDGTTVKVNGNAMINTNGGIVLEDDERNMGISTFTTTGKITNNGTIQLGGNVSDDMIQSKNLINNGTITLGSFSSITAGQQLKNAGLITTGGAFNEFGVGTGTVPFSFAGFRLFSDGTLDEVINGGASFGQIHIIGEADLSGALDITSNYIPAPGTTFEFMTFTPGDLTGAFSSVNFDGNDPFSITYDNYDGDIYLTALPLHAAPEPLPGRYSWCRCSPP